MNKTQKMILIVTACLIFIFTFLIIASSSGSPKLNELLTPVILFGIPSGLLYLAFRDKHEK